MLAHINLKKINTAPKKKKQHGDTVKHHLHNVSEPTNQFFILIMDIYMCTYLYV